MVSTHRRHIHSINVDNHLLDSGEEIKADLLDQTRILPDRVVLLQRLPKNCIVAEIGVAEGLYARQILEKNRPKALHLIDRWVEHDRNVVEKNFSDEISNGTVHLHQGVSWSVLAGFPDSYFDWVYIDAGHDYDSVTRDLEACRQKVKPGGYICGHDYITWSSALSRFGVVEAVNRFINETDSPLVYLTNQKNRHLSYAMQLGSKT